MRVIKMHIFECDYFKNIFKNVDTIISTEKKYIILSIKKLQ